MRDYREVITASVASNQATPSSSTRLATVAECDAGVDGYIVGAEDNQLPGYRALESDDQHDIQEARRLLYVGMTRAKDRLVLTRALQRDGRATGGDLFLREAGLEPTVLD